MEREGGRKGSRWQWRERELGKVGLLLVQLVMLLLPRVLFWDDFKDRR